MSAAPDPAGAPASDAPRFVSFAQNFEDVMLWRALGHVEHGFYVDVGAQDPVLDSVSKAFYDRGWDGIDIEPVPKYAALLRADRPRNRVLECALSDRAGREPLFVFGDSGLSTLLEAQAERNHDLLGMTFETREVEVRTLRDVLAETAGEIHWLKIDVEGAEQEVLASWQGSPVHPWIMVVEATRPNERQPSHHGWEPILLDAGYEFAYFDGLNRFYVAPEHRELHAAFGAPPNVFDRFALAAIDRLDRSFLKAERYAKSLEAEAASRDEAQRSELDAQRALAVRRGAELDEAAVYAATLESELEARGARLRVLERAQESVERAHIEMGQVAERRTTELREAAVYAASLEAEVAARGARLQELETERTRLTAALEESIAAATQDAAARTKAFVELETYARSLQAELRKDVPPDERQARSVTGAAADASALQVDRPA